MPGPELFIKSLWDIIRYPDDPKVKLQYQIALERKYLKDTLVDIKNFEKYGVNLRARLEDCNRRLNIQAEHDAILAQGKINLGLRIVEINQNHQIHKQSVLDAVENIRDIQTGDRIGTGKTRKQLKQELAEAQRKLAQLKKPSSSTIYRIIEGLTTPLYVASLNREIQRAEKGLAWIKPIADAFYAHQYNPGLYNESIQEVQQLHERQRLANEKVLHETLARREEDLALLETLKKKIEKNDNEVASFKFKYEQHQKILSDMLAEQRGNIGVPELLPAQVVKATA